MPARKYPDLVDIMDTPRPKPPYPYAQGQTKGGDTSEAAQAKAMRNSKNNEMREDAAAQFRSCTLLSAEGLARHLAPKWRARYDSEGDFLQDVRRRCSELVKLGIVTDSGQREASIRNSNTIRIWKINPDLGTCN